MNNSKEWGLDAKQFDLINGISDLKSWLPELESKLKSVQKFLRKVTKWKSPEMIMEMLPLLGFSIVGDNIEYDFWEFSVKFPIEKCFNESVSLSFSKSLVSKNLSDVLSDKNFTQSKIS